LETDALVQAFLAGTLPKPEWTHEAHLRVGLWHIRAYGAAEALACLRAAIRRYNEAVGTPNTDTSGYHETLTVIYVRLIAASLVANTGSALGAEALESAVLDRCEARDLPFRFYSRERLFSAEARHSFVAPDLAPLPGG